MHVNPLWQVWKDFVRNHYDWADEETMIDSYGEGALRKTIDTHKRINMAVKSNHKGMGEVQALLSVHMCLTT